MENFKAWVHNLDPFIWQFWGEVGIRWYGVAYLTGFIVGYLIVRRVVRLGNSLLKEEQISDFITYIVLGVMIGGRLGYALFYEPSLLTDFRSSPPFWGVFAVWEGGMASHGGILGVFAAVWLFGRKHKIPFVHLGDLTILGSGIGIMAGRIANFINGELIGRPVQSAVAWAVKFPQEMYLWLSTRDMGLWSNDYKNRLVALSPIIEKAPFPDQLGQMGTVSSQEWHQALQNYPTSGPSRRLINEGVDAIVHAVQDGNETVRTMLADVLTARHPSQLYAGISEGLIPLLVTLWLWRKPQKPGVVSAVFLAMYPISRVINEMFRTPDAHIGFQWLGLTRGQWLSLLMFVVTISYLVWALKRKAQPLGGWLHPYKPSKAN